MNAFADFRQCTSTNPCNGTAQDDQIFGTDGPNILFLTWVAMIPYSLGDGNDIASGGSGKDKILGDSGNDRLNGEGMMKFLLMVVAMTF